VGLPVEMDGPVATPGRTRTMNYFNWHFFHKFASNKFVSLISPTNLIST
jgi:hypothetical protein